VPIYPAVRIDGEFKVTVRYGYRVAVVAMPCTPKWRTEKGLALVGPCYFGYDVDYVPVEGRYG
jgi:uncharacterized protein